ncbi:MAG: phosphatidate cytidylyltransferase [Acutalibacteraceae bacterium]
MLTRILSGAAIAVIMVLLFILNPIFPFTMHIFTTFLLAIAIYEIHKVGGLEKTYPLFIPCEIFALATPWLMATGHLLTAVYAFALVIFAMMLFFHEKIKFADAAFSVTSTLLVTFGLSSLVGLYNVGGAKLANLYIFTAMCIPWGADIGGYFMGVFFGKHKLCPKVSPKKTVEGFIGSIIWGVALPIIYAVVYFKLADMSGYAVNYTALAIVSFASVFVSVLGDLTFSIIKRNYNIKDYGNLIPGHGGILDRFDSVIFTAPTMLVCLQYVTIFYTIM